MGELNEHCRVEGNWRGWYFMNYSKLWDGQEGMTQRVGTWAPTEQSWMAGLGQLGPASCHDQREDALHG